MSVTSLLDTFLTAYAQLTRQTLTNHCMLNTVDGERDIVAEDGSLCTVFHISGARRIQSKHDLLEENGILDVLENNLGSMLNTEGKALQIWFSRDPEVAPSIVENLMRPARKTIQSLEVDLEDVIREREEHLPKNIVEEKLYIAVWTRPSALQKEEQREVRARMKAPDTFPPMVDAQNFFKAAQEIRDFHESFVVNLRNALDLLSIRYDILGVENALRAIRGSVYPARQSETWSPALPGEPPMPRYPGRAKDASHLFPPKLKDQIFDREAEIIDKRLVRIGDCDFGCLDMQLGPKSPQPFNDLINSLRSTGEFPWRVSFLLEGDGINGVDPMGVKWFFAPILALTNQDNHQLKNAIQGLNSVRMNGEATIPRMRVSFATWAQTGNHDLLRRRVRRLQGVVNGWGQCQTTDLTGDPLAGVMTNALGMGCMETAPTSAPILRDALYMLPWLRDASPFRSGSVLFRTQDGRPWPYEPGSNLQHTWIDLVFAPPGYGKSVLLNTVNLGLCLSPSATSGSGGAELPQIGIIDIGDSSAGLISLLQASLPAHRQSEAVMMRVTNTPESSINPFDTYLGARHPLAVDHAFLQNVLSMICQPMESEGHPEIPNLANELVTQVYRTFDDQNKQGTPKLYTAGIDRIVDEAIENYGIEIQQDEDTWWDVVDTFFDIGTDEAIRIATRAQRYAVPLLQDITSVINSGHIEKLFGEAKMQNGERLLDFVGRSILTSINNYQLLQRPTQIDLGNGRVVSLDIGPAAPRGSKAAQRQTALVYMLARFALTRSYYINEDALAVFPDKYKSYQKKRIQRINETTKRLVMDEFHRTQVAPEVRGQVIQDMREGRKYNVQITLASQMLSDFNDEMREMASGVFILGLGADKKAVEDCSERFQLSHTGRQVVQNLNGPVEGKGAPFLIKITMKRGSHEHLLYNSLGSIELWAFSTKASDVTLRRRLYERLGTKEARRRLARAYPNGSAQSDIDRRVEQMRQMNSDLDTDQAQSSVIDTIAEELIEHP